jgi:hypothetical protein
VITPASEELYHPFGIIPVMFPHVFETVTTFGEAVSGTSLVGIRTVELFLSKLARYAES